MSIQLLALTIAAFPQTDLQYLDQDDREVAGQYSVMVSSELSLSSQAAAALDVFHTYQGISQLDDFTFYVFDPITGLVMEGIGEHENYSMKRYGQDLMRISDDLPQIFSVTVEAVGDDQAISTLGVVGVVADTEEKAQQKALEILWDARLDAASCTPQYRTELLH